MATALKNVKLRDANLARYLAQSLRNGNVTSTIALKSFATVGVF